MLILRDFAQCQRPLIDKNFRDNYDAIRGWGTGIIPIPDKDHIKKEERK